jgi:ubiquitin-conjugating enzyme E2 H
MSWSKRASRDIKELSDLGFSVFPDEGDSVQLQCFQVEVEGPAETPYEGGVWRVRFTLQPQFPFKSPSVGFVQQIYHPNIEEKSGSVCLDSLNKNWSPSFTIAHVVQDLLPYLLRYPNPDDPLNHEAAQLLKQDQSKFAKTARDHAQRYSLRWTTKDKDLEK